MKRTRLYLPALADQLSISCRHLAEAIAQLPKCLDVESHTMVLDRIEQLREQRDDDFNRFIAAANGGDDA